MRAIDTNVLARLILIDDATQHNMAAALLNQPVWITATVWLELGWVLGKRLRLDRERVSDALLGVLMTETVHTFDRDGMGWAIGRYRAGADWADMIHLVTARGVADSFATFDRAIESECGDAPPVSIETLA